MELESKVQLYKDTLGVTTRSCNSLCFNARVSELVYEIDLKSIASNGLGVQVSSLAKCQSTFKLRRCGAKKVGPKELL